MRWKPPLKEVFSLYWDKISADSKSAFTTFKVFDTISDTKTPLLTGVQELPRLIALGVGIQVFVLVVINMKLALGTEALAGPCAAVLDLDRAVERAFLHPAYNPTGACPSVG